MEDTFQLRFLLSRRFRHPGWFLQITLFLKIHIFQWQTVIQLMNHNHILWCQTIYCGISLVKYNLSSYLPSRNTSPHFIANRIHQPIDTLTITYRFNYWVSLPNTRTSFAWFTAPHTLQIILPSLSYQVCWISHVLISTPQKSYFTSRLVVSMFWRTNIP